MKDFNAVLVHIPSLFPDESNNPVSEITYAASGLFSLCSEIKKEGIDTQIIHLGIEKYLNKNFLLSDYLIENNVKFAAFSLQWHAQSYDVIEVIKCIKEKCPEIYITLGGVTASYFADEILEKFPFINSITKGEGELSMRLLAKKAYLKENDFSDIPNLVWRKDGKIIHNDTKFVATSSDLDNYEFFNTELMKNYESYSKIPYLLKYNEQGQLNNFSTVQGVVLGRGCMGNCSYCGGGYKAAKAISGRDFISFRSPNKVINEIKLMKKRGIEVFRFVFDPHPKNRNHLINLFNEFQKEFNSEELTVEFSAFSIPDKDFLDVFKKTFSKDSKISISADFYNEELRKKYRSFFFTNEKLEEILKYMDKLEIKSDIFFSEMPGVAKIESEKSINYAKELKKRFKYIQDYFIYPITIDPASPGAMQPEKYNFKKNDKSFVDYYIESKGYPKSFENVNIFNNY